MASAMVFNMATAAVLWYHFVCNQHIQFIDALRCNAGIKSEFLRRSGSSSCRRNHATTITRNIYPRPVTTFSLASSNSPEDNGTSLHHRVSIEYCTGCKWMLRAAWMSQELLTTFQDELYSVSMIPSKPPSPAGTFLIMLNDDVTIWNRQEERRFPEAKEVKQRIRDLIRPDRFLGHSDSDERKEQTSQVDHTTVEKNQDTIYSSSQEEPDAAISSYSEVVVQVTSSLSSTITNSPSMKENCDECIEDRKTLIQQMKIQFEEVEDDEAQEMRRFYGVG